MKASIQRWLAQAKRRIQHRLRPIRWTEQSKPMFAAQNIQYEAADRVRGLAPGGIGAMANLEELAEKQPKTALQPLVRPPKYEVRWFFWISNDAKKPAAQIVLEANSRCNQENLIAQLKSGCKALAMPEKGRWAQKHRQEKCLLNRIRG